MKKIFLSLVVAIVAATATFAQTKLVATLTHEDQVTTYYGASAFINAQNKAVNGDIIVLSSGTFTGDTIRKAVTIRGAGVSSTIIDGYCTVKIVEQEEAILSVEGVGFSESLSFVGSSINSIFNKCSWGSIRFENGSKHQNIQFNNCSINSMTADGLNTIKMTHSYISDSYSGGASSCQFLNCVISGRFSHFGKSTFINCILHAYRGYYFEDFQLPSNTIAMNCVAYRSDGYNAESAYDLMQGSEIDCTTSTKEFLFGENKNYELTDGAKAKFRGTDGTEIGLYGGQYPFNQTPSYPLITKLNVAKQATADNKLSVEIEVSTAE